MIKILLSCFMKIAKNFTMITEVWPRASQAMVTNNSTVITEVRANRNRVNQVFPVVKI